MHTTRIRALLTAEGLTQERLAESSGIAVRTIQRLEAGDEGSPETLTALANALSVPVRDLINPDNDPNLSHALERLDERDRHRWETDLQRTQQRSTLIRGIVITVAAVIALTLLLIAGVLTFSLATHSSAPVAPATAAPLSSTP